MPTLLSRLTTLAQKLEPLRIPTRWLGLGAFLCFVGVMMTAADKQILLFVCAGIMIWSLLISFLITGFQTILSPPDPKASFWVRFTYKLRYGIQMILSGLFIIAVITTVIMTIRLFNFSSVL